MLCFRTSLVIGCNLNTALVIFKSAPHDNVRWIIWLEFSWTGVPLTGSIPKSLRAMKRITKYTMPQCYSKKQESAFLMTILLGNPHTWSHIQTASAQIEDRWRNNLAMIRPNQHQQNIQDRETCQAWVQALFLLSSTSSNKLVLLRLCVVDKDRYRNERTVALQM